MGGVATKKRAVATLCAFDRRHFAIPGDQMATKGDCRRDSLAIFVTTPLTVADSAPRLALIIGS
jgi:hypothetical protein